MKLKLVCLMAMALVGFSCKSSNIQNSALDDPLFELTKALYTRWSGGQAGVRGINFELVFLKYTDNESFTIDQFTVNGVNLKVENVEIAKDTVRVFSIYMYPRQVVAFGDKEPVAINSINVPETGEIIFKLDGILHKLTIIGFEQLRANRYP